jgi:hypothetical protein
VPAGEKGRWSDRGVYERALSRSVAPRRSPSEAVSAAAGGSFSFSRPYALLRTHSAAGTSIVPRM